MEEFSDNQAADETLLQLSTEDATSIGALKGILTKVKKIPGDRVVTYKLEYSCILKRSCPQGGILSPLLWSININDLLEINIPNVKIQAYADDVCAIITSSKIATLESLSSRVFSPFQTWSVDNKFVFDKSKTEAILFSRKHQLPTVKLMYDGIEIPVKKKVNIWVLFLIENYYGLTMLYIKLTLQNNILLVF
ncbi:hypothetical protein QYM36_014899 [Artemia franciscana]|uniref:Reverse transcriptase domain-containing protein n=1 Tax=Artemia franciscana TaxID=6661 RepID=A0AA88HB26_ARTSF|nr:hypothetical protein QYM36_014899 [Artemia franciscana]